MVILPYLRQISPLVGVIYEVGYDGRSVSSRVDLRLQQMVRLTGIELLLLFLQQIADQADNLADFVTKVRVIRRRKFVDVLPNVDGARVLIVNLE